MLESLLTAKLHMPERSPGLLRRPRLCEALDHGVLDHRLTLVFALAGYGKTARLGDWAPTS